MSKIFLYCISTILKVVLILIPIKLWWQLDIIILIYKTSMTAYYNIVFTEVYIFLKINYFKSKKNAMLLFSPTVIHTMIGKKYLLFFIPLSVSKVNLSYTYTNYNNMSSVKWYVAGG